MHVDALSWSLNVPGAQSVGNSEPTEQKVPTGQITQSSSVLRKPTVAIIV